MGFRRILSHTRRYWHLMLFRILIAAASAATDIALAYLVIRLIDQSLAGNRQELYRTVEYLGLAVAAGVVFSIFGRYLSGMLGSLTGRDIRRDIAHHMSELPVSNMEARHTGDMLSILNNDVPMIQGYIAEDLYNMIFQPLRFIGAVAFLLLVNWKLLLFSIIIMPAAFLAANVISNPIGKKVEELQQRLGSLNSFMQDTLGGIFILKAFNLKALFFEKYRKLVNQVLDNSLYIEKRSAVLTPVNILIQILPFILCIFYGGYLAINGQISTGVLLVFIQMLNYIIEPAQHIPGLIFSTKATMGASAHMWEILSQAPEKKGGQDFSADSAKNYGNSSVNPVAFRKAAFSYDGENNILEGLELELAEGRQTALVGPSGCGKSTIIKLICGYYPLSAGEIMLYGKGLDKWDYSAARSLISVVSQDTYLFPATIAENIGYGRPGASLGEIMEAARLANACDFIKALPQGFETYVGERGARLSGGERQRIALARAALKNTPILLLDEPTSALDTESETLVQEALDRFIRGRTVLTVAHRLSTIRNAYRIAVMDQGRIVESGTHDELMKTGGLYRTLYMKQDAQQYEGLEETGGDMAQCQA